jgi:hypothetical protein
MQGAAHQPNNLGWIVFGEEKSAAPLRRLDRRGGEPVPARSRKGTLPKLIQHWQ